MPAQRLVEVGHLAVAVAREAARLGAMAPDALAIGVEAHGLVEVGERPIVAAAPPVRVAAVVPGVVVARI